MVTYAYQRDAIANADATEAMAELAKVRTCQLLTKKNLKVACMGLVKWTNCEGG